MNLLEALSDSVDHQTRGVLRSPQRGVADHGLAADICPEGGQPGLGSTWLVM